MNKYNKIIKEAIGINDDVRAISNFLYNKLGSTDHGIDTTKDGRTIYHKDDLPSLKNINLYKLIVDFNTEKTNVHGQLNPNKSKNTNKGLVIYLKFFGETSLSTIFHEVTHLLQFSKVGKKIGLDAGKTLSSKISASKYGSEKDSGVFEGFVLALYLSDKHEVTAKISEVYADIYSTLKNVSYDNNVVKELITKSMAWKYSNWLINYNIFTEFDGVDPEVIINFFSHSKEINKHIIGFNTKTNILSKIKHFVYFMLKNKRQNNKLLSDDEVISIMNHYNKRINNRGHQLKRKLTKLYAHFAK